MHKIIGVVLLVTGVFLLLQGRDLDHFHSQVRSLFSSSPAAKVTYYYLGGALCCAVGLVEFFRSEK